MRVDPTRLKDILGEVTFADHGDALERGSGHYLSEAFPNCEAFWRYFVVPLTRRIESFPGAPTPHIDFRSAVADEVREISAAHYSMSANLVDAHFHLEQFDPCWFEDVYVHLGTACDLAEVVLEKWYLLSLRCRKQQCHILQTLTRHQFLDLAAAWYDDEYPSTYDHYLSRGKPPPIRLPSRADVLTEYLGRESAARRFYASESQLIRQYRNLVVHDVKIGRIVLANEEILVPKSEAIRDYRSWKEVERAATDKARMQRDFEKVSDHAVGVIHRLELALDALWHVMIHDFSRMFFTEDDTPLHRLFDVLFRSQGPMVVLSDAATPPPSDTQPPPSGTFTAGSALFPPPEHPE